MASMFDTEDLLSLRRILRFDLAGDGEIVAEVARPASDESKFLSDLWRAKGDVAEQLTFGEYSDRAPRWASDGSIVFISNRPHGTDGDASQKSSQLWRLPIRGEARRLTNEAQGVASFAMSDDGKTIVYAAARYPGVEDQAAHHAERQKSGPSVLHYTTTPVRHWDRWLGAPTHLHLLDEGGAHDLTPDAEREHLESAYSVSPDGRLLAAVCAHNVNRMRQDELSLVDLETRKEHRLELRGMRLTDLAFSPSGARLAAAAYERREGATEARFAIVIDTKTRQWTRLAPEWDRFPAPLGWHDEETLLVAADDESKRPLFAVAMDGRVSKWADGHFAAAACRGGHVAALRSSMKSPPRLVTLDVAAKVVAPLSDIARTEASPDYPSFRVDDIRVPLSDGEEIQGLVAWPEGKGPHPLLLWIHGGPIGQFADQWHWRWNVAPFVAAGFAVAIPNARGSTGRGDAFVSAIYRDWGGRVFRDLMEYTAHLQTRDDIDNTRLYAMGGSFGGYMTNWIGANPVEDISFRALITHASLYDLRAFYGATDYPAFFGDFIGGEPWGPSGANLERHSPHTGIDAWKAPTLVIHGDKDYRVPIGEGLALFEALQAKGVESELVVFPDEGHWITRPRNVRAWYEAVLHFLACHA